MIMADVCDEHHMLHSAVAALTMPSTDQAEGLHACMHAIQDVAYNFDTESTYRTYDFSRQFCFYIFSFLLNLKYSQ